MVIVSAGVRVVKVAASGPVTALVSSIVTTKLFVSVATVPVGVVVFTSAKLAVLTLKLPIVVLLIT
jgi:hypothetical protein